MAGTCISVKAHEAFPVAELWPVIVPKFAGQSKAVVYRDPKG